MNKNELIKKYKSESTSIVDLESYRYYVLSTDDLVVLGEFMSHDGNQVILNGSLIFSKSRIDTSKGYQKVDFSKFHCEPVTRSSLVDLKNRVDEFGQASAMLAFYELYTSIIDLDSV